MSHFEYVTVLISFVAAFGVSQLLAGWARVYLYREHAKPDLLQFVGSWLILMALLQSVWGSWNFRDIEWTFAAFLLVFAPFLPVSVAAALVHPPAGDAAHKALRTHYFDVHRAIFLLMAGWVALGLLTEVVLHSASLYAGQWARGAGIVTLVYMAISTRPGVHWAGLALLAALQVLYIALVTPTLN